MDLDIHDTGIQLSQKKLISKGLELANIPDNSSVQTPLTPGSQLWSATAEDAASFKKLGINYRSHTGILNFLACRTRPDLAPAVSILSRHNHNPGLSHWKQVLHCWKYLSGTINVKLNLRPDSSQSAINLVYYTDATWADDQETRLSQSGIISFWKGCPLSWVSKKQQNITLSSTEAELGAFSDGVQEQLWVKHLVEELWGRILEPTIFNIDNKGLLEKVKNFGSNSKTKHIDIKVKWLRDLFSKKEIAVNLVTTDQMVADALTKACSASSLKTLQNHCFMACLSEWDGSMGEEERGDPAYNSKGVSK